MRGIKQDGEINENAENGMSGENREGQHKEPSAKNQALFIQAWEQSECSPGCKLDCGTGNTMRMFSRFKGLWAKKVATTFEGALRDRVTHGADPLKVTSSGDPLLAMAAWLMARGLMMGIAFADIALDTHHLPRVTALLDGEAQVVAINANDLSKADQEAIVGRLGHALVKGLEAKAAGERAKLERLMEQRDALKAKIEGTTDFDDLGALEKAVVDAMAHTAQRKGKVQ